MATAGLIGGLGPDTTVDYYRRIQAAWQAHDPATAPHLIIDSIDVKEIFRLVEFDRPGLADSSGAGRAWPPAGSGRRPDGNQLIRPPGQMPVK